MSNLFNSGEFILHSGAKSNFKLDCDALTDEDIESIATLIHKNFRFRRVVGIPRGGLRLEKALKKYEEKTLHLPVLIVDDVLTTGLGMEEKKYEIQREHYEDEEKRPCQGVVLFSRGPCPVWVSSIFSLNPCFYSA